MKVGDRVSVLDDIISGRILAVEGDSVTMETKDGFNMTFSRGELVVESEDLSEEELITKDISEIISEKKVKMSRSSARVKPKERSRPPMVVDLHIEKLVNHYKRMSNYEILTLQTDTAERQLNFAISKKIQRVVFVHGVGEGVLKAELEYLFRRYDDKLKYYEADAREYGRGATEVYIFQNNA